MSDLKPEEIPEQLVIIDGTWSQAKTMVRDLEQLHSLPHFKLAPTQPGQYRIRLEPDDTSLSTVEAAVEALREIEPETDGLDLLLNAFETMVQQQLDHPKVGCDHYSGGPKSGSTINTPAQLLGSLDSIVVVYGEAAYRDHDGEVCGRDVRQPVVWVAKKLGSGETFSCRIKSEVPLTESFLSHLELEGSDFESAVSLFEFEKAWKSFLREDETVVGYSQGLLSLLNCVDSFPKKFLTLKSINLKAAGVAHPFGKSLDPKGALSEVDPGLGRAGKRLANTIALIECLRQNDV